MSLGACAGLSRFGFEELQANAGTASAFAGSPTAREPDHQSTTADQGIPDLGDLRPCRAPAWHIMPKFEARSIILRRV